MKNLLKRLGFLVAAIGLSSGFSSCVVVDPGLGVTTASYGVSYSSGYHAPAPVYRSYGYDCDYPTYYGRRYCAPTPSYCPPVTHCAPTYCGPTRYRSYRSHCDY